MARLNKTSVMIHTHIESFDQTAIGSSYCVI